MVNQICLLLVRGKLARLERELALLGLTGLDDGRLSLIEPSDLRDTLSGGGRGFGRVEREIVCEFRESRDDLSLLLNDILGMSALSQMVLPPEVVVTPVDINCLNLDSSVHSSN